MQRTESTTKGTDVAGSASSRPTRLLLVSLLVGAPCLIYAQDSQPSTLAAVASELPAALLAKLDQLEDFSFDFDKPAYYTLLRHVRTASHPPGHSQAPVVVDDWQNLAERPRDFRGVAITVEGVVGVNRGYAHLRQPELGRVWQLELSGTRPQPCAVTVICTANADDVPLGATIRVTGYFVMMRSYLGPSQRTQTAALLIAAGPTQVSGIASRTPVSGVSSGVWAWLLAPALAGLLLAWLLLRRATAGRRTHDPHALSARAAAPESLSDDLARWAREDDSHEPR